MLTPWSTIQDVTRDSHVLFELSALNLERTQSRVLMDILARNQSCDWGDQHRFARLKNSADFQAAVPVVRYEDIAEQIDLQSQGHSALCTEPVSFYEETSGSSSGRKLIPYTEASLNALQHAVNPWLFSLIDQRTRVANGHSYWSISPAGRASSSTADGTPIGAPSDLSFLNTAMQTAFVELLSVPPEVALATDIDEWRYHTLFGLLSDSALALVSVWNPSFITLIIDSLPASMDRLCHDLGSRDSDHSLDDAFWQAIQPRCNKSDMLDRLTKATQDDLIDTSVLWPALDTISCWSDGSARQTMPRLRQYFPTVHVQPKGLLSTEAVVSIPFANCTHPVLAARSAFFEFLDARGNVLLAHELEAENSYEVLVTTYGGLYRYALGDKVLVRGHYKQLPLLEFIGRAGITSDLCGEKFDDAFVAHCLNEVHGFSLMAAVNCVDTAAQAGYQLFVDAQNFTEPEANSVCKSVERRLRTNTQYDYARRLGQLQPLTVVRIPCAETHYVNYRQATGQQLGDIKPLSLCIDASLVRHLDTAAMDVAQPA